MNAILILNLWFYDESGVTYLEWFNSVKEVMVLFSLFNPDKYCIAVYIRKPNVKKETHLKECCF
jgi:hypothetical protein